MENIRHSSIYFESDLEKKYITVSDGMYSSPTSQVCCSNCLPGGGNVLPGDGGGDGYSDGDVDIVKEMEAVANRKCNKFWNAVLLLHQRE